MTNVVVHTFASFLMVLQYLDQFSRVLVGRAAVNQLRVEAPLNQRFCHAFVQGVQTFNDASLNRPPSLKPLKEGLVCLRVGFFTAFPDA